MAVVVAVLLRTLQVTDERDIAEAICRRWKLSNEEREGVLLCLKHEMTVRNALKIDWPTLQRVLIIARIDEVLRYCEAVAHVVDAADHAVQYCRQKLVLPQAEWNPTPLMNGEDLKRLGIPAGRAYQKLLAAVRDAQLNGEITNRDSARTLAENLWKSGFAQ